MGFSIDTRYQIVWWCAETRKLELVCSLRYPTRWQVQVHYSLYSIIHFFRGTSFLPKTANNRCITILQQYIDYSQFLWGHSLRENIANNRCPRIIEVLCPLLVHKSANNRYPRLNYRCPTVLPLLFTHIFHFIQIIS